MINIARGFPASSGGCWREMLQSMSCTLNSPNPETLDVLGPEASQIRQQIVSLQGTNYVARGCCQEHE